MGLRYLSGLCFAFLSFSTLAALPPDIKPDAFTSYYVDPRVSTPKGVTVSPSRDITPFVEKTGVGSSARFSQTIPSGLTIEAIQKKAPLGVRVSASAAQMKDAAKKFFGSPKSNLTFLAASAGLQQLLDGVDWVMTEGSAVRKKEYVAGDGSDSFFLLEPFFENVSCPSTLPTPFMCPTGCTMLYDGRVRTATSCQSRPSVGTNVRGIIFGNIFGANYLPKSGSSVLVDVPASEIDSVVDDNYVPDPTDWRSLSPFLDVKNFEITSAPTLSSKPIIKTIYDADGNPVSVTETNTWYEFSTRDNNSTNPKLDMKERTETKTYKNGELESVSVTESEKDAEIIAVGGGGSGKETPTDCAFFPTLCKWLDWTQEDVGDEPDLSKIINDEDFERSYSIDFGDNSCPQPISIDIAFLDKTIELSYEPACDLMGYARPFVLISAYIFAIYIGLGVVRNG